MTYHYYIQYLKPTTEVTYHYYVQYMKPAIEVTYYYVQYVKPTMQ